MRRRQILAAQQQELMFEEGIVNAPVKCIVHGLCQIDADQLGAEGPAKGTNLQIPARHGAPLGSRMLPHGLVLEKDVHAGSLSRAAIIQARVVACLEIGPDLAGARHGKLPGEFLII
jgi:hypothetical protein